MLDLILSFKSAECTYSINEATESDDATTNIDGSAK